MSRVERVYTSAEQTTVPTCGVCGRRLGVGFYYSCHVCGASYCYAHAPAKCDHPRIKHEVRKSQISR
jgi:hypothetical protein